MAKHRKTRNQKLASDMRKPSSPQAASAQTSTSSLFTLSQTKSPITAPSQAAVGEEYRSLRKDLIKTSVLTISIIAVELMLSFIIKV